MKKTLFFAAVAALFTLASCQKEETASIKDQNGDLIFSATIDQGTKTTVNAATGVVSWVSGDEITITDAASTAAKYSVSAIDAQGKATFIKVAGQPTLGDGPYTAVYGTDPALEQTYSATAPSLPMSAESTTTDLTFTVNCGLLKLSLTAGESITSIEVTGTPAGKSETTYKLSCDTPVNITSGGTFYFAVPAGTYRSFLLNGEHGAQCKKTSSGGMAIGNNDIQPVTLTNLHFAVQLWEGGPYWATTNIGANSPSETGKYFAWGYTTAYSWTGSAWDPAITFDETGFPDYKTHEFADMAAANWGSDWSVPTLTDFENLINNQKTEIEYNDELSELYDGTHGILVTGSTIGYTANSIFLPASKHGDGGDFQPGGEDDGSYWSSNMEDEEHAHQLLFDPSAQYYQTDYRLKYLGYAVRAVRASL